MTTRSKTRLAAAAVGATTLASAPAAVMAASYVVRPGDTLTDIAVRHGTTVAALAQANGIKNPRVIRIGRLLQIPDNSLGMPTYTAGSADVDLHEVVRGESLFAVARAFGVDPTALARFNGIGVNAKLHAGAQLHVPGRMARMNALLTHAAIQAGIDPKLVRAVAWNESGWKQDAVSPTGAVGLMQIEPSTGDWINQALSKRPLDIHVAADNAMAGCLLLRNLLRAHNGDVPAALAGYYQGDGSIARNGVLDDTRRYQSVVQALYGRT
jgi:soluble lytic murein transglycosylase-like protein